MDRKLIRNGNGWVISINSTILQLLNVNPETDLVDIDLETGRIVITKSPNKREDTKKVK